MEVIVRPTTESAVNLVAKIFADAVKQKPDMVLGLATGRTMEAVYANLSAQCQAGKVDFSQCRSFNLDEYVGLGADNKNSYRYYMNHHLFDHINIDKNNTALPNGLASDYAAEAARYEWTIKASGGIDLQLLGIGRDGHIAFNEPLSSFTSRTRDIGLTPETIAQNSPLFDRPEEMPRRAFTMGVGTILEAKKIVLLATGSEKAEVIAKAVEGPMTSMISASALQTHPQVVVVLDSDAAAKLTGREYYDWSFANEPRWVDYQNC